MTTFSLIYIHEELNQLNRYQGSGTDKSGTGPTEMESHNLRSLEQTRNLKKEEEEDLSAKTGGESRLLPSGKPESYYKKL